MTTLAALIIAGGCKGASKPKPTAKPPLVDAAGGAAGGAAGDEPTVEDDDILVVPATRQGDVYELRFGEGRALLSLAAGTLVAPDPDRGAIALAALAKWLDVPVPAKTHSQPLVPIRLEVMAMGDDHYKVFIEDGGEHAELYINVRDATHVELVPKDAEYAPALADLFADALRDGPAPARTMQTDPNLESEEPLFVYGRTLDVAELHHPACVGDGWVGFVPADTGEDVLAAPWDGARPARVCTLPGAVDDVAVAAGSPHVVALVTARDPSSPVISTGDRSTLWRVSAGGCTPLTVPAAVQLGPFSSAILSPTGADVAIVEDATLFTFPVGTGKPTRAAVGALDLILAWDADGLVLHDLDGVSSRIQPGGTAARIADITVVSPDRRFGLTFRDGAIEVADLATKAARTRTFAPQFRSDARAIARIGTEAPAWAGRRLVLRGSPDLALDLHALKTRPLGDAEVVCTNADGTRALMTKDDVLAVSK